jgi:hypothetical protein
MSNSADIGDPPPRKAGDSAEVWILGQGWRGLVEKPEGSQSQPTRAARKQSALGHPGLFPLECRDEDEVRVKMKELGLVGQPGKRADR